MQDKQWQPPRIPSGDMRGVEFALIMSRARPHYPVSDKWMRLFPKPHGASEQRDHMCRWFSQSETPGMYGRSRPQTARQTYNRLQSPAGLLWIAEAMGVERGIVRAAANSAYTCRGQPSQCAAIRRVIPWSRIYTLAQLKSKHPRHKAGV